MKGQDHQRSHSSVEYIFAGVVLTLCSFTGVLIVIVPSLSHWAELDKGITESDKHFFIFFAFSVASILLFIGGVTTLLIGLSRAAKPGSLLYKMRARFPAFWR